MEKCSLVLEGRIFLSQIFSPHMFTLQAHGFGSCFRILFFAYQFLIDENVYATIKAKGASEDSFDGLQFIFKVQGAKIQDVYRPSVMLTD